MIAVWPLAFALAALATPTGEAEAATRVVPPLAATGGGPTELLLLELKLLAVVLCITVYAAHLGLSVRASARLILGAFVISGIATGVLIALGGAQGGHAQLTPFVTILSIFAYGAILAGELRGSWRRYKVAAVVLASALLSWIVVIAFP